MCVIISVHDKGSLVQVVHVSPTKCSLFHYGLIMFVRMI